MELRLVCLLLGLLLPLLPGATVAAVSLDVRPNLQQFFSGQFVSLSCPGGGPGSGWTIRRSKGGQTLECGEASRCFCMFRESTCVLDLLSSYTGLYWCQSGSGQQSEQVNLTVTLPEDSAFVLEIPALPVLTGSDVTLQCRHKDGSAHSAYFFKDGDMVGGAARTSQSLREVRRSDEGLYWCSTDKSGSSPRSFLRVRDPPPPPPPSTSPPPDRTDPPNTSPPPPPPPSALHLLRHLLVVCPYCVCTFVLLSFCCGRTSGKQPAVSTTTTPPGEERDVATEHDF